MLRAKACLIVSADRVSTPAAVTISGNGCNQQCQTVLDASTVTPASLFLSRHPAFRLAVSMSRPSISAMLKRRCLPSDKRRSWLCIASMKSIFTADCHTRRIQFGHRAVRNVFAPTQVHFHQGIRFCFTKFSLGHRTPSFLEKPQPRRVFVTDGRMPRRPVINNSPYELRLNSFGKCFQDARRLWFNADQRHPDWLSDKSG